MNSPLGPIRELIHWRRIPGTSSYHEGKEATYYYVDQVGNEYNSVGHLLRCAIAKELGL